MYFLKIALFLALLLPSFVLVSSTCSAVITQSKRSFWGTGQDTYSIFDVTITNAGDAPILNLVITTRDNLYQYWNMVPVLQGFSVPSYVTDNGGLAVGNSFEWGYVTTGNSGITFTIQAISCSGSQSTQAPSQPPNVQFPTQSPTSPPSASPTSPPQAPTQSPTWPPSQPPSSPPSQAPTQPPSQAPTQPPAPPSATQSPTQPPSQSPTNPPSQAPSRAPTQAPIPATSQPSQPPSQPPTQPPIPATQAPSQPPTQSPTQYPTQPPTQSPTQQPPSQPPTQSPTQAPDAGGSGASINTNLWVDVQLGLSYPPATPQTPLYTGNAPSSGFCTGTPKMYKGKLCATTTRYYDGQMGACGCGTGDTSPYPFQWTTYTAAASPPIYGYTGWCGRGCGKCFNITTTGYSPNGKGTTPGQSIVVAVTNLCPPQDPWCANGLTSFNYLGHFDLMDQNMNGLISAMGWDNPEVYFEQVPCTGQTPRSTQPSDLAKCQCQ